MEMHCARAHTDTPTRDAALRRRRHPNVNSSNAKHRDTGRGSKRPLGIPYFAQRRTEFRLVFSFRISMGGATPVRAEALLLAGWRSRERRDGARMRPAASIG